MTDAPKPERPATEEKCARCGYGIVSHAPAFRNWIGHEFELLATRGQPVTPAPPKAEDGAKAASARGE